MVKHDVYYTVYLEETDEVVAFGRSQDCARMMGVTMGSFYSMVSRVRGGVCRKYAVVTES